MHTSVEDDEAQGPVPTPRTPPPSHPNPSEVGAGLGRDGAMLSLGEGVGGGVPTMTLAELLELSSGSATHSGFPSRICARPLQAKIIHPKISYPTQQLRTALVCTYSLHLLYVNVF